MRKCIAGSHLDQPARGVREVLYCEVEMAPLTVERVPLQVKVTAEVYGPVQLVREAVLGAAVRVLCRTVPLLGREAGEGWGA